MKTMRRAIVTATIGVMAAGVIGFAAPTASASETATQIDTASVSCEYYKDMARKWQNVADSSNGKKAHEAKKMSQKYLAQYFACAF
ncbi:MAG TPA: hypothetical protein H9902_12385 [Candidatus Stackebrandtia faecavium]|nr:hypothetical protein [Candidatus Stackebrandtia faecavium]